MQNIKITINDQMESAIKAHLLTQPKEEAPGSVPGETIVRVKSFEKFVEEQLANSMQFLMHAVSTPETRAMEQEIAAKQAALRAAKIGGLSVALA